MIVFFLGALNGYIKSHFVRKEMQQSGTIMAYNGEITDELMVSLGDFKERLKSLDNAKVSRTVLQCSWKQCKMLFGILIIKIQIIME